MKGMTLSWVVVAALLAGVPAMAQEATAPGCGDPAARFEVQKMKGGKPTPAVPGKATVIVIEDDTSFASISKPTARIGVDGRWVGATHGNSFLEFAVDPGVHHLCSSWEPMHRAGKRGMAAAHFTAEAGEVYYFEVKDEYLMGDTGYILNSQLKPMDSDEGNLVIDRYEKANSTLKK